MRRRLPPAVRRHRVLEAVGGHALMIALGAMFVMPFVFVVLTALMTDNQALSTRLWPRPFEWINFTDVFHRAPLLQYTWNSMQIAMLSTAGTVVSSVPVAYALARLRWRARRAVFLLVLSTIMLPFQVTVIPLYILFSRFHWIGTMRPLIIPAFFGDAFSIFLLRQFFASIPEELSDAARVDGANELQILTRVIVPLAKPAIAAVALFQFLYAWNDFFGPLLYLGNNPRLYTLAIGLSQFRGIHNVEWNLLMAASVLFMLPVIVLFFLAQRIFIQGISLTGLKG